VVQRLPSMREALGSIPAPKKKRQKEKNTYKISNKIKSKLGYISLGSLYLTFLILIFYFSSCAFLSPHFFSEHLNIIPGDLVRKLALK
jgi:hypothetical protein